MKAAKIISFIAFILHSVFTLNYILIFQKINTLYQETGVPPASFPITILVGGIFAVLSFLFWLYLRKEEKKGKTVEFALLISFVLLLAPPLFLSANIIRDMIGPIYSLMGNI